MRVWPHQLATIVRAMPDVDPRVADALIATPRHRFVHWRYVLRAYKDTALPTGPGTTISQPSYIARVISAARIASTDRVLEIGAGSGWTAAIFAKLAAEVVTIDRMPQLVAIARKRLARLPNVRVLEGDGEHAADGTFDAIVVMAGAPEVPTAYTERLRDGGRLVIPIGRLRNKTAVKCRVTRVTRAAGKLVEEDLFDGDWNLLRGKDGFV
ncbi:MAG TPA: methyltransferase domain-containing protein [Kofleriaceae bacterium]